MVMPKCCLFNVQARSLRGHEVIHEHDLFNIWPVDKRILLPDKWNVKDTGELLKSFRAT
jgi:hypothetical protein